MRKIRLAYLIDTIHSAAAGTEKQLLEIITRLDRQRFEPYLISLYKSAWMAENRLPCPAFDLGFRGFISLSLPAVVWRYRRLLREQSFDLVQTFFEESIFIGYAGAICRSAGPELISSRRDIGLLNEHPWYHGCYRLLKPLVNRKYRAIIANGSNVRRQVIEQERIAAAKVFVVPNGVSVADLRYERPRTLSDHPAKLWIGLVANLKPVKRQDLLLEALSRLFSRRPELDLRTLLLGEGRERARLAALAERLGLSERLHFEGSVADVRPYLQHLDVGVLCSDREGLPNAVLEYMAAGLPVIATDVGDIADLVDRTNGLLVPPGKPELLSAALETLADDEQLRQRLGAGSLDKVQRHYTWERSLASLERLYFDLLGSD